MFECLKMIMVEETGRKPWMKQESREIMWEPKERHGQQYEHILLVERLMMPRHPMMVINKRCWFAVVPPKRRAFGTLSCYHSSIVTCRPSVSHDCCSYVTAQASRCWPNQSRWVSKKLPDQKRSNIYGDPGSQIQDNCIQMVPFQTLSVYHARQSGSEVMKRLVDLNQGNSRRRYGKKKMPDHQPLERNLDVSRARHSRRTCYQV